MVRQISTTDCGQSPTLSEGERTLWSLSRTFDLTTNGPKSLRLRIVGRELPGPVPLGQVYTVAGTLNLGSRLR